MFHGSLSDSFGRRRILLVSLVVYSLTAVAGAAAPSFEWLLTFRVIQGLAAGAGMIVSRAIIRDRFAGSEAQRFMAQVTMVGGLGPAIAPIMGGWLHHFFGWRGPFVFLGLLGTCLLWACHRALPETLHDHKRQSFQPKHLARAYWETIRNPAFLGVSLALALGGGGFLLYVATAPDVALNILGLSETQFGWLFAPIVAGLMMGAALTSHKATSLSLSRWAAVGYASMAVGASLNLIYCLTCSPRLPWAVLPLGVYTFGFALVAPAATIQALDIFPQRKGLASSLQGFFQTLVFAVVSSGVARLVYRSGLKHAVGMAAMLVMSWMAYRFYQMRIAARLAHT
ncbi:MAG TPA: multidrug effflux MFS transporter [Clostridia bacterium]|nr:multidrug effflux MFS transporter [Clostridia bacterium]